MVFALAALAGIGLSGCTWSASATRRNLAALVLLGLATGESLHGTGSYVRFDYATRIHQVLATSAWPGAVVELPIYRRHKFNRNVRYLLASTTHWRPLVNGFGAFAPPDFDETARLVGMFPSVPAVARHGQHLSWSMFFRRRTAVKRCQYSLAATPAAAKPPRRTWSSMLPLPGSR